MTLLGAALREPEDSDFFCNNTYDRCRVRGRPLLRGTTSGRFKSIDGKNDRCSVPQSAGSCVSSEGGREVHGVVSCYQYIQIGGKRSELLKTE